MKITKMHGAGNDFVILQNLDGEIPAEGLPGLARRLCAFHTGVGADGMMVVAWRQEKEWTQDETIGNLWMGF